MLIEAVIPLHLAGQRLDRVLAQLFPDYSRSRLSQWIERGVVHVNGKIATSKDSKKSVMGGEHIQIVAQPLPETQAFEPEPISLSIIYEDETLMVIDKPAHLVVHPGHGNWSGTLLNGLLHHHPALSELPRAGIVHRLDKDTSGLLVIAKTLASQMDLVRQLQARTVKREYQALVWGMPSAPHHEHRIETWMGRHPQQRTRMAVLAKGFGKRAITFYRVHRYSAHHSWVFCRLATGRTHQIRVHLAHLGSPILGDITYGRRHDDHYDRFGQHALHAFRLQLTHPSTGKLLQWKSSLPAAFSTFIDQHGWNDTLESDDINWDDEAYDEEDGQDDWDDEEHS
jgi:23S rRNA pseudouridine1911/1915/1917 synthase